MSEISKAYEPQSVETKWYDFWLEQQCFTADPARVSETRPAYSIVIPPPNVTGVLTMGHVLNNTIQDVLARKARMEGKEVLWLPGTDHAGIATQNAVEKALKKAGEIKHRDDLGREALVARIWEWKEKYGGIILKQLRALGASCDWSRTRFTMDPEYSRCVQQVFVDLYKKGLIYRGKRMVNWCPASLTALSDEEVVMKEQKGWLYTFAVGVVEYNGDLVWRPTDHGTEEWVFLKISTTRPETIPGDVAIAVNPDDERYRQYIGKYAVRPLPMGIPNNEKLIPIIGDKHVDPKFGTGVLKVTPCHDKADYEIALRHGLPCDREVIGPDGKMTALAGDLEGLDRFAARSRTVDALLTLVNTQGGYLGAATHSNTIPTVKEEQYLNNVGFSERADVPIEPRLSEQWFLKYPSVDESTKCVATGDMQFFPDRWAKVYDHWMGGIQDWCISRQLWWGHRIPVWRLGYMPEEQGLPIEVQALLKTGQTVSFSGEPDAETVLQHRHTDHDWSYVEAATLHPSEIRKLESLGFTQDPDVLDTWFSSWLWPFATMGWTGDKAVDAQNPSLKAFYPTTDLVTGPDIIFFWVARMIMAGYEWMGDLPFKNVYFTGIIRDKQGRKMSKSLGNSPDPLDLIAKYGADALRFGVMRTAPLGQDVLFDEQTVELGRNFCNKLWNACRFRQMVGTADSIIEGEIDPALLTADDRWILLRLDQALREVTQAFTEYKFSDATATLYRCFWSEYCDWYIEASKAVFHGTDEKRKANKLAVLDFVLGHLLRLFHPFLPFITEELWHGMGYSQDLPADRGGKTIVFAIWPRPFTDDEKSYFGLDETADRVAQAKYDLVSLGRTLRRELKLDPAKKLKFILKSAGELPPAEVEVLKLLLNAEAVELVTSDWTPDKGTPSASNSLGELYLPTTGLIDFGAERARLTKELETIRAEISKVETKLSNPAFAEKVPAKVLEEHRQRLIDWQAKEKQVLAGVENLPA